MLYQKITASLHYWVPSSVPLTTDGIMKRRGPVFLHQYRRRLSVGEINLTSEERDYFASWSFLRHISSLLLVRNCEWLPESNSTKPCKAATRSPVTMHDAVQFPCAIRFGYGVARPACLTTNPVILQSGMCYFDPRKRARRNPSCSVLSAGQKLSPNYLVVGCMNSYSCWRDFCRPT